MNSKLVTFQNLLKKYFLSVPSWTFFLTNNKFVSKPPLITLNSSTRVERRVNNIGRDYKKDIFSASVLTPMHVVDVTLPPSNEKKYGCNKWKSQSRLRWNIVTHWPIWTLAKENPLFTLVSFGCQWIGCGGIFFHCFQSWLSMQVRILINHIQILDMVHIWFLNP